MIPEPDDVLSGTGRPLSEASAAAGQTWWLDGRNPSIWTSGLKPSDADKRHLFDEVPWPFSPWRVLTRLTLSRGRAPCNNRRVLQHRAGAQQHSFPGASLDDGGSFLCPGIKQLGTGSTLRDTPKNLNSLHPNPQSLNPSTLNLEKTTNEVTGHPPTFAARQVRIHLKPLRAECGQDRRQNAACRYFLNQGLSHRYTLQQFRVSG